MRRVAGLGDEQVAEDQPAITIGTLTMKIDPHQKCSSRTPPVIGPSPRPSADTPAQTPIALPRSAGSVKTFVMIDNVDGMMNAPPTPMSARVPISMFADVANADRAEPMPNTARPKARKRYRPKRSPRLPAVSSSPANTRVYASTIHCSWLAVAPRPPWALGWASVGMATLRIVLSSMITIRLMQSTSKVSHRRR